MDVQINNRHLSRLDPKLRALLDAELAAGNAVGSTGECLYQYVEILVGLKHAFRSRPASLPAGIDYEETLDHWTTSGTICDYRCQVPAPRQESSDYKCWHVLRAVRD